MKMQKKYNANCSVCNGAAVGRSYCTVHDQCRCQPQLSYLYSVVHGTY